MLASYLSSRRISCWSCSSVCSMTAMDGLPFSHCAYSAGLLPVAGAPVGLDLHPPGTVLGGLGERDRQLAVLVLRGGLVDLDHPRQRHRAHELAATTLTKQEAALLLLLVLG